MVNVGLGDGDRVAASTASAALGDHVLWHSAAGLLEDVPVGHLLPHGSSICDATDSPDLMRGEVMSRALLNHCIIALQHHWGCCSQGSGVSRVHYHGWAPALGAVPPRVHALLVGILGTSSAAGPGDTGAKVLFWQVSFVSVSPLTPAIGVP